MREQHGQPRVGEGYVLGLGVEGLEFRVYGSGFRVEVLRYRVWGLGFRV